MRDGGGGVVGGLVGRRKVWYHLLRAVMTPIADIWSCGRQQRSCAGDKTDAAPSG